MPRSDFSALVKNPKMKLVLQDCGHLDSATLGRGYTLQVGIYKHCCTSGPSTWYRKAGISLRWWSSPKSATVDEMKRNLQSSGMVQVWAGTGQEANAKLNSSKYLRPGDIGSMLSSDSAHAVMWTGEDWRSDCIQGTRPYPYSSAGRGGNQTFILWRHPSLQEPGLSVQGDGLGNQMDDGMSSGFSGGCHDWPDFNIQSFPIMTDKNGQYTSEPLLLGIANHLRMEGVGGVAGAFGDTFGDSLQSTGDSRKNAELIIEFFMKRLGLTRAQAAGIAGVGMAESECMPDRYNVREKMGLYNGSSANGSGYGAGIWQWSNQRKNTALALIGKLGPIENLSLGEQCEMLAKELESSYKSVLAGIKKCNNAAAAAATFYCHSIAGFSISTEPATQAEIDKANARYAKVGGDSQINKGMKYANGLM